MALCPLLAETLPQPWHILPHEALCMETLTGVGSKTYHKAWVGENDLRQAFEFTR